MRSSRTRATPRTPSGRCETTVARFGGLDGLVCNAGTGGEGSLRTLDRAGVGTTSCGRISPARFSWRGRRSSTWPRGAERSSPSSSAAGIRASPDSLAYCASKAGLAMLTQCIAVDHGPEGVRANCVCPGWVRTPMADEEMAALGERLGTDREGAYDACMVDVPLRRAASPGEVAALVAWLLLRRGVLRQRRRAADRRRPHAGRRRDGRIREGIAMSRATVAGVEVSTDHFIGGERVASDEHASRTSRRSTQQPLAEVARGGEREAELAVAAATEAFPALGGPRRRRARRAPAPSRRPDRRERRPARRRSSAPTWRCCSARCGRG